MYRFKSTDRNRQLERDLSPRMAIVEVGERKNGERDGSASWERPIPSLMKVSKGQPMSDREGPTT